MIRTKDLLLFAVIIVFLIASILFTLARQQSNSPSRNVVALETVGGNNEISGAVYEPNIIDRESIISRLRTAISTREVEIKQTEIPSEEVNVEATISSGGVVALQTCSNQKDALDFARTWPREGVTVQVKEGARLVAKVTVGDTNDDQSHNSTSSVSTPPVIILEPLLQLPLNPVTGNSSCVASEIVGVTVDGSLMFNSDAIAYVTTDDSTLIGYARDGVPVYGAYSGQVDECGGYTKGGQYRYSVGSERNYILGCYKAAPKNFVGE